MPGQQDFPEWRGVESIFEFPGIIPGIDCLYFFRPFRRRGNELILAFFGQGAIRVPENLMITKGVSRKLVQLQCSVPEFTADIL